ncbi:hypothetical protein [Bradyrhizobium sp.]|uniref:hypothetical protein n=1 Tax=Bradyrhizobium sp. TaxID=376 RepID=UPI0025BF6E35|nr:hypothetical protein [Bradyrhizobium sp.]
MSENQRAMARQPLKTILQNNPANYPAQSTGPAGNVMCEGNCRTGTTPIAIRLGTRTAMEPSFGASGPDVKSAATGDADWTGPKPEKSI